MSYRGFAQFALTSKIQITLKIMSEKKRKKNKKRKEKNRTNNPKSSRNFFRDVDRHRHQAVTYIIAVVVKNS